MWTRSKKSWSKKIVNRINFKYVFVFIERFRYRSWVILDNDETKISDVYAYTAIDARRRASQRALEALMKKQPSHVNNKERRFNN